MVRIAKIYLKILMRIRSRKEMGAGSHGITLVAIARVVGEVGVRVTKVEAEVKILRKVRDGEAQDIAGSLVVRRGVDIAVDTVANIVNQGTKDVSASVKLS
jgi:hypothetical protein